MNKIIKIVLLIIVPLLVAAGISVYAYYRYQSDDMYFYRYYNIEQAEYKDTEDHIQRYFMYNASYYDKYYEKNVKVTDKLSGEELAGFKFVIYRWFDVDTYEDEDGEEQESKNLKYVCLIYNVNYANVYHSIYNSNDKDNKFNNYLPIFKLTIVNQDDEDETSLQTFTFGSNTNYGYNDFTDFNFTGYNGEKKWQNGEKIVTDQTSVEIQWLTLKAADISFDQTVNFKLKAFDQLHTSEDDKCFIVADEFEVADFYLTAKKLNTENGTFYGKELVKAYDEDVVAAGYNKYVFTKWIWWEAILAIVLVEVVTASTVIVWENENEKERKQNA